MHSQLLCVVKTSVTLCAENSTGNILHSTYVCNNAVGVEDIPVIIASEIDSDTTADKNLVVKMPKRDGNQLKALYHTLS